MVILDTATRYVRSFSLASDLDRLFRSLSTFPTTVTSPAHTIFHRLIVVSRRVRCAACTPTTDPGCPSGWSCSCCNDLPPKTQVGTNRTGEDQGGADVHGHLSVAILSSVSPLALTICEDGCSTAVGCLQRALIGASAMPRRERQATRAISSSSVTTGSIA